MIDCLFDWYEYQDRWYSRSLKIMAKPAHSHPYLVRGAEISNAESDVTLLVPVRVRYKIRDDAHLPHSSIHYTRTEVE